MEPPLSRPTRLLLASAGGLAVIAGPALLFFPNDTGFARQRTLERAAVGLCATAIVMSFLLIGGGLERDAFDGQAASTALYVGYLAGALAVVIAIGVMGIGAGAPASLPMTRRAKRRPTGGATNP